MKDLSHYRKSYEKSELSDHDLPDDPLQLFSSWFHETEKLGGDIEANAMTVSTFGTDGFPKSRIVLLKQLLDEGFVFFTNYTSEKGKSIELNHNVCLSFFWPTLERQVIIKGRAEKTSIETSDSYFNSRPYGSKLGAIVSDQSEVIASREELERKLKQAEKTYEGKDILRPEHWGGYLVRHVQIEFWQGRANRLHDRIVYSKEDGNWTTKRLAP